MTHTSAGRKGAHRRTAVLLFLALLAVIPGTELGYAQATLRGRVVDSELGTPLPAAAVRIRGGPEGVVTDTLGLFEVQLRSGQAELNIQLIGYAPGIFMVQVPASGVFELTFAMDFNGNRLPEQVVRARAERLMPRYVDFEQRRQRKLGAFLRWDELERQGAGSVGDALRKVRGVRIKCDQQTFECFAYMSRTPTCQPTWWIDGVEVRSFHENTPIRDVYGVEIYRGAGEVPGEFSGSNAACGVIVIWTKSRPFK